MSATKILITGATGYIGGSVLTELLKSTNALVKTGSISALVRGKDQAEVLSTHGVTPILFKSLDDLEYLEQVAAEFDVIINSANAFHTKSAEAFIRGLAQRKEQTGNEVYFIHTSGTSSVGDRRVSGTYIENRILSDKTDDIYSFEKALEGHDSYPQRATDVAVIETGLTAGVKTYILMPPTIYGTGTGFFNRNSIQIPTLIRTAIRKGHVEVIGPGEGYWNHAHVEDVAKLFELFLGLVLEGKGLRSGKEGIYFAETGEHTWLELAERVGKAGFELGVLKDQSPVSISLETSAGQWGGGSLQYGELGWASSSRTRAVLSREIGWKPTKTRADFEGHFLEEFKAILEKEKN
ncbi:hypothetical protein BJX70DRAFT_361835 [Aspergillus crustosus]